MSPNRARQNILVTVGMGPWPFDRLLEAIPALAAEHDVFAQTGMSEVDPGCPHAPFIGYQELTQRIEAADIVITHAGNTVRLVQRAGGVPIAVAREHARGEMGNDHQVAYLRQEEEHGRVLAVWDVASLPDVVAKHSIEAERLLAERRLAARADPESVADLLDRAVADLVAGRARMPRPTPGWDEPSGADPAAVPGTNPFARHPLRRYDFAWRQLAGVPGPHLDLGAGFGDFAGPFAASTGRDVSTVDAMPGYVDEVASRFPAVHAAQLTTGGRIPFSDGAFASVSLLDVLEHAADERLVLSEAHRVLADDGLIVVSVPRRHVFSWLDPDNVKFRWPRAHRSIYRWRFGDAAYGRRFADQGDGFVGDIASNRGWHTNYRTDDVLHLLESAGFTPESVEGANLFWRWFHVPYLLGGRRAKRLLGPAIRVDGDLFTSPRISANLFIVARKRS